MKLSEQACKSSGLSESQVQLWMGQRMNVQSPLYNMTFVFVLESAIDVHTFQAVWQELVDTHSVLRTYVDEEAGLPKRKTHPKGSCPTDFLDYSNHEHAEADFEQLASGRCSTALPLQGPLIDSVLVKLSGKKYCWYLNLHHLITDAASTLLLFNRMMGAYTNALSKKTSEPVHPVNNYYETIKAISAQHNSEAFATAQQFWKNQHQQSPDRIRYFGKKDKTDTTRSERLTLKLSKTQTSALKSIATEPQYRTLSLNMSLFAVWSTVFTAWLHHISGFDEIRFDAPVQNRPTSQSRKALGLFIELFPFATTLEENDTFKTLGKRCLAEAQSLLKNALSGSNFSEQAVAASAVLNFFPGTFDSVEGIPVCTEWIHPGHSDSVHGVRLQIHDFDNSGKFTLHFDFNNKAFTPEDHVRSMAVFKTILAAFIENRECPVKELDILSESDRQALLVDFNQTNEHPVTDKTIVEWIREQCSKTPEAVAVRQGAKALAYSELQSRIDTLASALIDKGVRPERPVAIYMKRSIDSVIAILATLASGSAYVPIDPGYPEKRIRYILEDCDASLILTHRGLEHSLSKTSQEFIDIEKLPLESETATTPSPPSLKSLAYIIYTSGSTGNPKGVMVEHEGLSDYLSWAERQYVRGDRMNFALFTSLSFDLTITSIYLPLMTGGTLVIYEEGNTPLDSAIIDVISDNAVDIIKLTPSHLSLLQQMDLKTSRLQRMIIGGEDLKAHLCNAIIDQFSHKVEIYNEYGPTEGIVGCMIHRFNPAKDTGLSVPIGTPADHVQLYVLNEKLKPVAPGVPGELCMSRTGLARGYHNQPVLTKERFIAHPFRSGERLYRTGDKVRFNEQGLLEYLGRIDRQLKVSGFRIEPSEIERVLVTHPAVEACIVRPFNSKRAQTPQTSITYCAKCGLPSDYPQIVFDEAGICDVCHSYEAIKDQAQAYFKTMPELKALFEASREKHNADYDCIVLLSGGKDSTYALCQLIDMGLKVFAYTLDNGYLSTEAKGNIKRVIKALKVTHEFAKTSHMSEIFKDSLTRFSNVCNGCFKTIYTLAVNKAKELSIPIIVTGLSRGQFFETRLTGSLFAGNRFTTEDVDRAVLEARKVYHRTEDAVTRSLGNQLFQSDRIFNDITFVDFYRYCDVSLGKMLDYLHRHLPWVRPKDTGRSTNCLINDVGIYIHKKERGYHNYALPYSWDVRMGHKTREEAIAELNDELVMENIKTMLSEIDYDEDRLNKEADQTRITVYYTASQSVEAAELRRYLADTLPSEWLPHFYIRIEEVPLTKNGKVDFNALPLPAQSDNKDERLHVPPKGPVQEQIARVWQDILAIDRVSVHDSFFQLGGSSLSSMEVILKLCQDFEIDLPLQTLFEKPTIIELNAVIEEMLLKEISLLSEEEASKLANS